MIEMQTFLLIDILKGQVHAVEPLNTTARGTGKK